LFAIISTSAGSHGFCRRVKNGEDWHRLHQTGSQVNSEYYCQHVPGGTLLPDIRARCQRYSWILQQDGAPSQHENITFTEPDMWLPNSLVLNQVNYAVWGALQQMVYQRRRFTTINQVKHAISTEWGKLSQHSLIVPLVSSIAGLIVSTFIYCAIGK